MLQAFSGIGDVAWSLNLGGGDSKFSIFGGKLHDFKEILLGEVAFIQLQLYIINKKACVVIMNNFVLI